MLAAFTVFHVVISLIGIATGFVVIAGMMRGDRMEQWTAIYLGFTVATSVTGFLFPFHGLTPGMVIGALSLVILAGAIYGRYGRGLDGGWRATYVVGSLLAQYFNVFVLVVQSFQKVPALKALAPTQSEPPFAMAQGVVLVAFAVLGWKALKGFRTPAAMRARAAGAR